MTPRREHIPTTSGRARRIRPIVLALAAVLAAAIGLLPLAAHASEESGTFQAMVEARWVDDQGNAMEWPANTVVTVDLLKEGEVIDKDEPRDLGYTSDGFHASNEFAADCEVDYRYSVSVRSIAPEPGFEYTYDSSEEFNEEGQLVFHLTLKRTTPEEPKTPEDPQTPEEPDEPDEPKTPEDSQTPEDPQTPETPEDPKTSEEPAPKPVTVVMSVTPVIVVPQGYEFPHHDLEYEFRLDPRNARVGGRSARCPGERELAHTTEGQPAIFSAITFESEGVYYYAITQRPRSVKGVTFDTRVKMAQVEVKRQDAELVATVTYGDTKDSCTKSTLEVTNYYKKYALNKDVDYADDSDAGDKDIFLDPIMTVDPRKPSFRVFIVGQVPDDAVRVTFTDELPYRTDKYIDLKIGSVRVVDFGMEKPQITSLIGQPIIKDDNDLVGQKYAFPLLDGGQENAAVAMDDPSLVAQEDVQDATGGESAAGESAADENLHLVVDIPDATGLQGHWVYVGYAVPVSEGTDLHAMAEVLERPALLDVYTVDEDGNLVVTSTTVSDVPSVDLPDEKDADKADEGQKGNGGGKQSNGGSNPGGGAASVSSSRTTASSKQSTLPATGDPAGQAAASLLAAAGALLAARRLARRG